MEGSRREGAGGPPSLLASRTREELRRVLGIKGLTLLRPAVAGLRRAPEVGGAPAAGGGGG